MNLSIVVPAYNIANYITPMFNSLLHQSEQQFEIIIVDDGSTDETYDVVTNILENNSSLTCKLIRTVNQGVSAARNRGLSEATGDYVLFLDGDDYVSNDLVQTINAYTNDYAPEIICWGYSHVTEGRQVTLSYTCDFYNLTGGEVLTQIFEHKSLKIWTGSIAFSREFLLNHELNYTERCVNGEDQEFIYKALSRATKVITIPELLSFYLQRDTSITNSYNVKKFGVVGAFKRVDEYFKTYPFAEQNTISGLLMNRELVENYFFNIKTCLSGSERISIHHLLRDIDQTYPLLNQEMYKIIKQYRGDDKRVALYIRTFLISPRLHQWFITMERNSTLLKRKMKTMMQIQRAVPNMNGVGKETER